MHRLKNKSGFTLLEIIIVIIIIGILASLALPKFFQTVQYSKAQEGLSNLGILRRAMNRCYVVDGAYTNCDFTNLDVEDPSSDSIFSYGIASGASTFTITATLDSDSSSTIAIDENGDKTGAGVFAAIR